MNDFSLFTPVVAMLFLLMAFRAFRSGSAMDYVLGGTQGFCLVLLFTPFRDVAYYLLLFTAFAYFLSQVLTGARLISRLLPLVGAVTILLALLV